MNTKQLRQKILDLAIRGKLVPQDPKESITNYELRITREETPFEIPKSWRWVRLRDVGIVITGTTPSKSNPNYYGKEYPFFKPTDLETGINTTCSNDNLSTEGYNCSRKLPANSVLVTCIGATIGKTGLIRVEGTCNQQINAIIPNSDIMLSEYLYYYCISNHFQNEIKNNASATTLPILNKGAFEKLFIPLPPLPEQRRIVSVIESAFALIDEIETNKQALSQLVKQTKSKVLDLAIRGKLVPQNPDELITNRSAVGASSSRAKPEDNYELRITREETPFEIPKSWRWVSGYECLKPMENKKPTGKTFRYIDINSIDNKKHIIKEAKLMNVSDAPSRASRSIDVGDTLFSMVRPYLENIAYVDENYSNCIASTGFFVCKPTHLLYPKYLYYLMLSSYVIDGLNAFMKGDNSPSINYNNVTSFLYPLPPHHEQHRIVAKIEQIFAQLDEIEKMCL